MKRIALCFLLYFSSFAEEIRPVFSNEVESASVVNDVHVVTGQFIQSFVDHVLPGPDPLIINRHYATRMGSLDGFQYLDDFQGKISKKEAFFPSLTGSYYLYAEVGGGHYHFRPKTNKRGLTNYTRGFPLGKNHPKNTRIVLGDRSLLHNEGAKEENSAVQYCSDGTRRYFTAIGVNGSENFRINRLTDRLIESETYLLTEERLPSGNWIEYTYEKQLDTHKTLTNLVEEHHYFCTKISVKNAKKEKTLCHLEIIPNSKFYTSWARDSVTMKASDGKVLEFKIQKVGDRTVLSSVDMPGKRAETYSYEFRGNKYGGFYELTGIKRPEGRKVEIEYYRPGNNEVFDRKIKVDKDSFLESRVKRVNLPLGQNGSMVTVRTFFYHFDTHKKVEEKKLSGSTETYDAYKNRTDYLYNQNGLIEKKLIYNKETIDLTERYFWGSEMDQGQILAKTISDASGCLFAEKFEYDPAGNVTKHTLIGNLTGQQGKVELVDDLPRATQENSYTKEYRYSDDGYNLLLWEREGDKEVWYHYIPNTNLLRAVITRAQGKIQRRVFHSYDENASLVETIEDDGEAENPDDLSNVTQRKITRIKPRSSMPAFGMPEEISTYYYDLAIHAYHLLRKEKFTYDNNHNEIKKAVFDANNSFVYEIHSSYDVFNNLLSKTDPLGRKTSFEYDENNNLIKVLLPKKGAIIENTFDFVNRKIAEKKIDGSVSKLTRYIYDNNNNLISEIDSNDNETKYIYDHRSRLVQTIYPKMQDLHGNILQPTSFQKYNGLNHVTEEIDPLGNKTRFTPTVRAQVAAAIYADNSQESITYLPNGEIKEKISKTGLTITYEYDYDRRITKSTSFDANTQKTYIETKTYDAFHLLSETDPNGHTTTYHYDLAGRVKEKKKGYSRVQYSYDALSRICSEDHYSEHGLEYSHQFSYDLAGRMVEESWLDSDGQLQMKKGYGYDELGNQFQTITYGVQGQEINEVEYDLWQRPLKITDAQNHVTTFSYGKLHNAMGQMVDEVIQTDPDGLQTITTFDAFHRPVLIQTKKQKLFSEKSFIYDANGNVIRRVEKALDSDRSFIEETTYDNLGRPIEQRLAKGTPEEKVIKMRYNTQGFLSQKIKPDQISLFFTYDGLGNKLSCKSSDESIDYLFKYDLNSNLIQTFSHAKVLVSRKYDHNNLLIAETIKNQTTKKTRDALGRVLSLILPDGSEIIYQYKGTLLHRVRKKDPNAYQTYLWENPLYDLSGRFIQKPFINAHDTIQYTYNKCGLQTSLKTPHYSETITYNQFNAPTCHTTQDANIKITNEFTYDALRQLTKESGKYNHQYNNDALYNPMQIDDEKYTINALNQIIHTSNDSSFQYDPNGNLIYKKTNEEELFYKYDAFDRLISIESPSKYILHFQYDHSYRRIEQFVQEWGYSVKDQISALVNKDLPKTLQDTELLTLLYDENLEIGSIQNYTVNALKVLHPQDPNQILSLEIDGNAYTPVQDYRTNIAAIIPNGKTHNYQTYRYSAYGERLTVNYYSVEVQPISSYGFMGKRHITDTTLIAFGFRDYDITLRRWITPDPAGFVDGLNLYAFVQNNPLAFIDVLGLAGEPMDFGFGNFFTLPNSSGFNMQNPAMSFSFPNTPNNNPLNSKPFTLSFDRSQETYMSARSDPPLQYFYNPGINTSWDTCRGNVNYLSDLGATNIQPLHYEQSLFKDLYTASQGIKGNFTDKASLIVDSIVSFHQSHPLTNIALVNHSGGVIAADAALRHMKRSSDPLTSRAFNSIVSVINVAPGSPMSSFVASNVMNFVSPRDFVPYINTKGYLFGLITGSITYVPAIDPKDHHGLKSLDYKKVLEREFRDLNENYGF